jgi:hypothetical protein
MPGWDARVAAEEDDRRNDSEDVNEPDHSETLQLMSAAVGLLGKPVLLRWEEDGWFYPAVLRDCLSATLFTVEDESCITEAVSSRSFLLLDECERPEHAGQLVLAEHPAYERSFAPGRIHRRLEDGEEELIVVFYDLTAAHLEDVMAFVVPSTAMYQHLVRFAEQRDASLLNANVVAQAPEDGLYYRARVVALGSQPRHFTLAFEDGGLVHDVPLDAMVQQESTGRAALVPAAGGHALALYYDGAPGDAYEYAIYGPAKVRFLVQTCAYGAPT